MHQTLIDQFRNSKKIIQGCMWDTTGFNNV